MLYEVRYLKSSEDMILAHLLGNLSNCLMNLKNFWLTFHLAYISYQLMARFWKDVSQSLTSISWVVQFQEFVVYGNPPQKSINYIIANKTVIFRYTVVSVHFQTVDTRNLWILCELRTYKWNEGVIIAVVFAI